MSFPPRGDEFYTHHPQEVFQGELTNMKAQLGRPTGLALVLLFTLLATFLAMGVFSVAQAQTTPTRSFSSDTVEAGGTLQVTITLGVFNGQVVETLPGGFTYVSSSFDPAGNGTVTDEMEPEIVFTVFGVNSVTYTVMAPDPLPAGAQTFGGVVRPIGSAAAIIDGETSVNVPGATNGGNGGGTDEASSVTLSSQEPGAAVRIEISANAVAEVTPGEDINIKLASFDLPETMSESHVLFSGAAGSYTGNPSEARVSGGDTIILTVPSTLPNGNANPTVLPAVTRSLSSRALASPTPPLAVCIPSRWAIWMPTMRSRR